MARPVKNTVDYFPHYCNHKKTIFILEQQYGNNGYAFWFKLLELLGSTEKHFINCNNKSNWKFLQAKTHFTEEKCIEILNLLVELEAIDKNLWNKKIIWCQNFIDNIADVYKNRRVAIPIKPSFYKQKPQQSNISTNRNRQSKVKKSKVKKKKEYKEIYIVLSKLLGEILLERQPKERNVLQEKERGWIKWAEHIRLLIERDKETLEDIKKVIKWCQDDNFWKIQIRSTGNLRDKFGRLKDQMNNPKNQQQEDFPVRDLSDKDPWEKESTND